MAISDATRLADFGSGIGTDSTLNLNSINATGIVTATSFDGPVSSATGDFSIADKIIHTGDTNTALRFPAADTFTVETGGSERLRITSAGKVGIGTASPEDLLHISDGASGTSESSNAQLVLESGASTNYIVFQNPNTQNAGIKWVDAGGQSNALINYDHNKDNLWIGADDDIKLATAGSERLRITETGNVGINTDPGNFGNTAYRGIQVHSSSNSYLTLTNASTGSTPASDGFSLVSSGNDVYYINRETTGSHYFSSGGYDRLTIKDTGQVCINTTNNGGNAEPTLIVSGRANAATDSGIMHIKRGEAAASMSAGDSVGEITFTALDGGPCAQVFAKAATGWSGTSDCPGHLIFKTTADGGNAPVEAMRIDSSGKVGIGTITPYSLLEIYGPDGTISGISLGSGGSATASRYIGICHANDHTQIGTNSGFSGIEFGGPSSTDEGYLAFHTHDNGVASAERMRIDKSGRLLIGKTSTDDTITGVKIGPSSGENAFTVPSGHSWAIMCNRQGDDGTILLFRQANTDEGSISVSGSTVSYNGAHLSRWSQLANGAVRIEILRGSVLSNLDEMCEWGEEDNEQLNRMKVSDVEGDKNVSGVFQSWDDDDDTYVNDFYCAMTGDFVIRIAQGTTVARGDLLMSAGDGTAKPQDDDIVRSKTIAKVTSTNVSETYADNSYCVPCVLMAC